MSGHLPPSLFGRVARYTPSSTCESCSRHATPAMRKFKERRLKPVDKSLTWEDEEFLRLKNGYIEKGLNEFTAEQRAYKEVYENYSDIAIGRISHNHANDFKREMLEMMFPNEDLESEDFEDGLDMEDMYD